MMSIFCHGCHDGFFPGTKSDSSPSQSMTQEISMNVSFSWCQALRLKKSLVTKGLLGFSLTLCRVAAKLGKLGSSCKVFLRTDFSEILLNLMMIP